MSLTAWKELAEIMQAIVTSVALAAGAIWAYFKFIKGRTFTPHVETETETRWLGSDGGDGLRVRIRLKNIGQGKVQLEQMGTGVMVSRLAPIQPLAPSEASWELLGVYEIFAAHQWIEPDETVGDDLLIRLGIEPAIVEVRVRIILKWKPSNVAIEDRRIFDPMEGRDHTAHGGSNQGVDMSQSHEEYHETNKWEALKNRFRRIFQANEDPNETAIWEKRKKRPIREAGAD